MSERYTDFVIMTKILRLTRHAATRAQLDSFEAAFGGFEVKELSESLPRDAKEAVARFDELAADFDVVDAVLPIALQSAILKFSDFSKRGGVLLRSVMDRELQEDGSAVFTFVEHRKVLEVKIVDIPLIEG